MKVSKTDYKTQKEMLTKCIGQRITYKDTEGVLEAVEIGELLHNPDDINLNKYWDICVLRCNNQFIYPKIYEVFKIFYPHLCSW